MQREGSYCCNTKDDLGRGKGKEVIDIMNAPALETNTGRVQQDAMVSKGTTPQNNGSGTIDILNDFVHVAREEAVGCGAIDNAQHGGASKMMNSMDDQAESVLAGVCVSGPGKPILHNSFDVLANFQEVWDTVVLNPTRTGKKAHSMEGLDNSNKDSLLRSQSVDDTRLDSVRRFKSFYGRKEMKHSCKRINKLLGLRTGQYTSS